MFKLNYVIYEQFVLKILSTIPPISFYKSNYYVADTSDKICLFFTKSFIHNAA
jgi:hypothetical protein